MELQSLIKYHYAWNAYHYFVEVESVNIPLHSFVKSVNNIMWLVLKLSIFYFIWWMILYKQEIKEIFIQLHSSLTKH